MDGKFVKCEISQIRSFPEYIPDSAAVTAGFLRSCVMVVIPWYDKLAKSPNPYVSAENQDPRKICKIRSFANYKFSWIGAIHKGCLHIRGRGEGSGGGSGKSGQMQTGGGGVVSQMWTSAWKKNHSYHICEIYLDNLAVCLYIKFSFCLYSIENVEIFVWPIMPVCHI